MVCHASAPSIYKALAVQEKKKYLGSLLGEAKEQAWLSQQKDKASSSHMNHNLQEFGKQSIIFVFPIFHLFCTCKVFVAQEVNK